MSLFPRFRWSWSEPGRGRSHPADPAVWLEHTEKLVDGYRLQRNLTGRGADPALGYIWIAADHIFERHGRAADFSLLDVPELVGACSWLAAGRTAQFVTALAAFYAYLDEAGLIEKKRAATIRAQLACIPT